MEFNLKQRRERLFEELLDEYKHIKEIKKILFVMFNCIDNQDDEFIRLLRKMIIDKDLLYECPVYEKGCVQCEFWKDFDKLVGDLK